MLEQLRIENLATIQQLEVEFDDGFTILTGETGAGKSIMIDAILLVLGHKGDAELIRTGEEQTVVEAVFQIIKDAENSISIKLHNILSEADIALEEELIIRCVVSRKGRQKRLINGVSVTAETLKTIGRLLINIHGQHDNQSLLQSSSHLDFLDGFGNLMPTRLKVNSAFQAWKTALKEQENFRQKLEFRSAKIDQLKEIIDDLEELALEFDEENELRNEEKKLTHFEKLNLILSQSRFEIQEREGSILEQLENVRRLLAEAEQITADCSSMKNGIESALYQIEDTQQSIVQFHDPIEAQPNRLAWINERLSRIQHFLRKYQLKDGNDLLKLKDESLNELSSLEHFEENEMEMKVKIQKLEEQLKSLSEDLSVRRNKKATELDQAIIKELRELGMEKAQFKTDIQAYVPSKEKPNWSQNGIDEVEFLLTVNPGQALRSLAKVASGGELSRIMLAMKTILTSMDTVDILIFDEVDTGISGRIAEIVGKKLRSLGNHHQTLCVTHQPQIAACAKQHYIIRKKLSNDQTFTEISRLKNTDERVQALAELMGGEKITERTLGLAKEMLLQDFA